MIRDVWFEVAMKLVAVILVTVPGMFWHYPFDIDPSFSSQKLAQKGGFQRGTLNPKPEMVVSIFSIIRI